MVIKTISRMGHFLASNPLSLVICAAFDFWLFSRFHTNYIAWYIQSGEIFALIITFAALAWGDLNKDAGLISPNPREYMAACALLIAIPLTAFGTGLVTSS